MILRRAAALVGDSLEYVPRTDITIAGGRIAGIGGRAGSRASESADCEGLLVIPGLINAHTHVGDSAAKDAGAGLDAASRIHPVRGAKRRILSETPRRTLARYMRRACESMLRCGTTTFVDFREGGEDGARLLRDAAEPVPIRAVVLGRIDYYHGAADVRAGARLPPGRRAELARVLRACDGIGISGANECSDALLRAYSRTPKLRAIHAAETRAGAARSRRVSRRSEAERALLARPHVLVHMTHASRAELAAAARRVRGIVACPQANSVLGEGLPDLAAMEEAGNTVALGTDNVMLNAPDMLAEMSYAWKSASALRRAPLAPSRVLAMATVNAGRMLRRRIGSLRAGMMADAVLIDMHSLDVEPARDVHAAIVQRASRAVRAVMVGGRIVHGRI